MKILYNVNPFGGFILPYEVAEEFNKKYGEKIDLYIHREDPLRYDPRLIELYEKSQPTMFYPLLIEEVPDEVQKNESKQQAKVEDKITKVEEVTEPKVENVSIEVDDALKSVEETDKKNKTQQIKKR